MREVMAKRMVEDYGLPSEVFDEPEVLARFLGQKGITNGVEIEAWAEDAHGNPIDLIPLLGATGQLDFPGAGFLTHDAGFDHGEVVSQKGQFLELEGKLQELERQLLGILPPGSKILYRNARENKIPGRWAQDGPRYRALLDAVEKESGPEKRARFYDLLCTRAATHVHVGGIDPWSPEGVDLINRMNNLAPAMAAVFHDKHQRNGDVFSGWTIPERLPAPRWFESPEEMRDFLNRTPRLLRHLPDGQVLPDTRTVRNISDEEMPLVLKSTWWLVRPTRYDTVEVRAFPSLPPEMAACATYLVDCLVKAILEKRDLPLLSSERWWEIF